MLCTPNDPTGADHARACATWPSGSPSRSGWSSTPRWPSSAPDEDVADLLAARERVLIVRSFSKAHAMAGLRAGYALANDADLLDR